MVRYLAVAVVMLSAVTSCVVNRSGSGSSGRMTLHAELGKAESVRAEIAMGAGELRLTGGATKLVEGEFAYGLAGLKPEMRYEDSTFRGKLTLRQTAGSITTGGDGEDKWRVRLNESVPLDLELRMGAGQAELDLSRLALRRAEIEIGAGQLKANLDGTYKRNVDLVVRGGVGEVELILPSELGVRVEARGALGSIDVRNMKQIDNVTYVNDAWDKSPVKITADVRGGIGQITLICR